MGILLGETLALGGKPFMTAEAAWAWLGAYELFQAIFAAFAVFR